MNKAAYIAANHKTIRSLLKGAAIGSAGVVGTVGLTGYAIHAGVKNIRKGKHPVQVAKRLLVGGD